MKKTVLITGGAGYIGSHTVLALEAAGYDCVVVDNLSTGHRDLVSSSSEFVLGDISDRDQLAIAFSVYRPAAIVHFAASAYVGESVREPRKYYENNIRNTLNLLGCALDHGTQAIVFSSSCATYGQPDRVPINEETPQRPINPYGHTKLMVEQVLADYDAPYALRSVKLRYFNVAGANADAKIGERHEPETHLIPLVLSAAAGRRDSITVNGADYPTADGTCVRDYVHVEDLARAHVEAVAYLLDGGASCAFNVGIGKGFSVHEVIESARRVTGNEVPVSIGPRRPGDPAALVADPSRIQERLGWQARFTSIDEIVSSAWKWHLKDWQRG